MIDYLDDNLFETAEDVLFYFDEWFLLMLYYDRIVFKFQNSVFNECHYFTAVRLNLSVIAIITGKVVDYGCIIHGIRKSETIYLLESSFLDDRRYM